MKAKLILFISIAFVLSACGGGVAPTAVPTRKGEDIQSTAIAAAFTVMAQTHEALPTDTPAPTNTPVPPTETATEAALPTETSLPRTPPTETPTTVAVVQASPTSNGSDPCSKLLTISGGKLADFRIVNQTNSPITASVYLNQTPFGDCGYRGYNIAKGNSVEITDLVFGCYNVGVFINSKKPTKVFGYGCINNYDRWTFFVNSDGVVFSGK